MKFFISGIFFLSITFVISNFSVAYGDEPICEWILENKSFLSVDDISFSGSQKVFTNINSQSDFPIELSCIINQQISLKEKLIAIDYEIISPLNYDFSLSIEDINGNIISSQEIREWYDIYPLKKTNIVLDPADFERVDTSNLRDSEIDLELTKILKIKFRI